jgi:cobalamin synthase
MRHPQTVCRLGILLVVLAAGPRPARAQAIARPHSSVLWAGAPSRVQVDTGEVKKSEQSRDALIGGVLGAVAGAIAGHAACRRFGASGDCTGATLYWGALFGAIGLLIGAAYGYDADH